MNAPAAGLDLPSISERVQSEVQRAIQRSIKGVEYFSSSGPSLGSTPKDIVPSMTIIGARAHGIERERETIRDGLAADIIATPGNPYDDINVLKQVAFVMKDGRTIVSPTSSR